jgi:hypothetical protein
VTTARHIAHFNWATLKAPVGDPRVSGFVDAVDRVNGIAERSPGFVWRLGDEGSAAIRIGWPLFTDDQRVIASFSVWERPEDLKSFVYKTVHGAFFRRRDEWFEPGTRVNYALWWIEPGHVPEISEAREKVEALITSGASDKVFTFTEVG